MRTMDAVCFYLIKGFLPGASGSISSTSTGEPDYKIKHRLAELDVIITHLIISIDLVTTVIMKAASRE